MTNNSNSGSKVDRRHFVVKTALAAAAVPFVSASRAGHSGSQQRQRIRWRFEACRIEEMFSDGSTLPFFRYVAVGNTRNNGRLPLMQDRESRMVSVSILNRLEFPIQPTIVGYDTGPVIMPQEKAIWNFVMPPAGTYVFSENLLGNFASSAGFAAAMVSNPLKIKPTPPREYYLLFQNADDRWNNAIDIGKVPNASVYEPNYHTINGLAYPETVLNGRTKINCRLGETILLRIANFSNIRQTIHFHGYHLGLILLNHQPVTHLPAKDSFAFAPFSTAEILLPVEQTGLYPIHPHSLTATTNNGHYLGGAFTLIDARKA